MTLAVAPSATNTVEKPSTKATAAGTTPRAALCRAPRLPAPRSRRRRYSRDRAGPAAARRARRTRSGRRPARSEYLHCSSASPCRRAARSGPPRRAAVKPPPGFIGRAMLPRCRRSAVRRRDAFCCVDRDHSCGPCMGRASPGADARGHAALPRDHRRGAAARLLRCDRARAGAAPQIRHTSISRN